MARLIRAASSADLDGLVDLVAACFDPPWSRSAIEGALLARGARAHVAEVELEAERVTASGAEGTGAGRRAPVGFVLARRILDEVEIDLVGVSPSLRRRGLAARLLAALLEDEQRAGTRVARLELSAANAAAAALYASLGFMVVGRRPRYYPDGQDALLLARTLG